MDMFATTFPTFDLRSWSAKPWALCLATPESWDYDSAALDDEVSFLAHGVRPLPGLQHQVQHALDLLHHPGVIEPVQAPLDVPETPPETPSSDLEEGAHPWQGVHLCRLGEYTAVGRVRWDTREHLDRDIRFILQLDRQELLQLHLLRFPPADLLTQGLQGVIVQHAGDLGVGENGQFVVVDSVFHEPHPTAHPEVVRSVRLCPPHIMRNQVIDILGLRP